MEFKYRVATLACHCWTVLVAVMLYCIGLRIFSFLFILFIAVICDILRARFVVDLYQSIMTSKRSLERASNDDAYAKNIAASSLATISTLNWVLFVGGIVYAAFMPRHFPFFGSMLTDDVGTLIHWLTPLGSTYSTNTSPEVQRAELSLSMFFGIWILFVFLGCAIAGTSHSYRVSHKLAYLDAQKATRSGRKLASRLIAVTFFLLFLIIFASVTRLLIAFLERSQYRDIIDGSPIGFYISMTVLGTGIISIAQRLYAYLFIYRASISRLASSPDTYK